MTMTKEERHAAVAKVLCDFSDDTAVLSLLTFAVGRALERQLDDQGRLSLSWEQSSIIRHVADWLAVAVMEKSPWLSRLDTYGRPLKLMKLGSLEAANNEADKAMRKHAQKVLAVKLVSGAESLEAELEDGYYVVRLLTPEALDVESGAMQHCIGHGSYDASLGMDGYAFYSLRDQFGKPHATLEVRDDWVLQCQGKQNKMPDPKYVGYLLSLLVSRKWKTREPLQHRDYVAATDHAFHHVCDLPDGLECKGNLNLSNRGISSLPRDLRVGGNLDIRGTAIKRLPDGLSVRGGLYAYDTPLEHIGNGVSVGGTLNIQGTPVTAIPEDIVVSENLLARETAITSYPAKALVMGVVDLSSTPISSLPEGLQIVRSLDLTNCKNLVALPASFVIGNRLSIRNTAISRIPPGVKIGRSLCASGSKIEDIGTQKVWEALDLADTPIKRLPDNLMIVARRGGGVLSLSGSAIEDLGQNLKVTGRLVLTNTLLSEMPDVTVKGELDISRSQLRIIPDGFRVAGTLNISDTQVSVIPEGMEVTGNLVARRLESIRISAGVKVGKAIDIGGSTVVDWSDGGAFGGIVCGEAVIARLPRLLEVQAFVADDAEIDVWPERMVVQGLFTFKRGAAGVMPAILQAGAVDCSGSKGVSAPASITAIKRVDFSESRFQSYPDQVVAENANFRRCQMTHLPAAWKIGKNLAVDRSRLETIEAGLVVMGNFSYARTPLHRRQEIEGYGEPTTRSSVRIGQ